jgi:hypothetical protein
MLTVDFAAVADPHHDDEQQLVLKAAEQPEVADAVLPVAPEHVALERLTD